MFSLSTKEQYEVAQQLRDKAWALLRLLRAETAPVSQHDREVRELEDASLLGMINELESQIREYLYNENRMECPASVSGMCLQLTEGFSSCDHVCEREKGSDDG